MGPTLAQILTTENLKIKIMIPSGKTNMEAMETFGNKVLGYKWHATDDVMVVALPINTSGRVRKMKQRQEIPTTEQKLKTNVFAALIAKKDSCNENLDKLCDEVRACCACCSPISLGFYQDQDGLLQ